MINKPIMKTGNHPSINIYYYLSNSKRKHFIILMPIFIFILKK